jgi:hypothetical protein
MCALIFGNKTRITHNWFCYFQSVGVFNNKVLLAEVDALCFISVFHCMLHATMLHGCAELKSD